MANMTLEQIDQRIRDLNNQLKLWKKLRRQRTKEQEVTAQLEAAAELAK
jgi:hypothetical protein